MRICSGRFYSRTYKTRRWGAAPSTSRSAMPFFAPHRRSPRSFGTGHSPVAPVRGAQICGAFLSRQPVRRSTGPGRQRRRTWQRWYALGLSRLRTRRVLARLRICTLAAKRVGGPGPVHRMASSRYRPPACGAVAEALSAERPAGADPAPKPPKLRAPARPDRAINPLGPVATSVAGKSPLCYIGTRELRL